MTSARIRRARRGIPLGVVLAGILVIQAVIAVGCFWLYPRIFN